MQGRNTPARNRVLLQIIVSFPVQLANPVGRAIQVIIGRQRQIVQLREPRNLVQGRGLDLRSFVPFVEGDPNQLERDHQRSGPMYPGATQGTQS